MPGFEFASSSSNRVVRSAAVVGAMLLLAPASAKAGVPMPSVVEGNIVLAEGDTPTGGPAVTFMGPPYVNDAGDVGFVGGYDDGDHYVFVGNAVVWSGADEPMFFLDALETRMDSNALGNWVYPMDADGADGLYSDAGLFAVAGDPVPMVMDANYTYLGNPVMLDDGAIYFVAGVNDGGDPGPDYNALFFTPDGTPAAAEIVLAGGDMLDAFTVAPFGVDFDYDVSRDGMHRINLITMADGGGDTFVRADDMMVARQGDPTGSGDDWDTFGVVSINTTGDYLFSGETTGSTATDDFLAYNSDIVIREGDVVGGVAITQGSDVLFATINDVGQATYGWVYDFGGTQSVFFACNAADIPNTSQPVFTTGDGIDVDADGMADFDIVGLNLGGPTPTRSMGGTNFVYASVTLGAGGPGGNFNAMVEMPVTCCGNGMVDPGEECDDGNEEDTDECLATCVAASCGDGIVQDGVEECDDGNDDDTDECPTTCEEAFCGDGFVQDGEEECDDGNDDDDDECRNDCTEGEASDTGDTDGPGDTSDSGPSDTGSVDTGGSGGGSGPGPATFTTMPPADGTGGEGDTDTDTDGSGAVTPDDGCNCRSGRSAGGSGMAFGLFGLGLLALGRRRRRS